MIEPQTRSQRHALVIGNNDYAHLKPLRTAVGDARAIGELLDQRGFLVTQQENIDYLTFNQVLARFATTIRPGDKVVLHFSGHGVAIDARNYLVPTDMPDQAEKEDLEARSEVKGRSIEVGRMIDQLRANKPAYVFAIIDACRTNPLSMPDHRSIGLPRGLAFMGVKRHSGVFILYSAEPEHVAHDRLGPSDISETSVFTRVLLPNLKEPGQTLQFIAKETQIGVNALAHSAGLYQVPEYTDRALGWATLDMPDLVVAPESPNAMISPVSNSMHVPVIMPLRPRREESVPANAAKLSAFFHTVFGNFLYPRHAEAAKSGPLDLLGSKRVVPDGQSVDGTHAVTFSPDGTLLACGSSDGCIRLWNIQSGRLVRSLERHTKLVRSVAFAPDGRFVVSGGDDKAIRLSDPESGVLLNTFVDQKGLVRTVAFSPDGKTFAAADLSQSVKLLDAGTRNTLHELAHAGCVLSLAYSPDGILASGDEDGWITMWDPEVGNRLYSLPDPGPCVTALAFSPSESAIACGMDGGSVAIRDVVTGETRHRFESKTKSFVASVAFSSEGDLLAAGNEDGTMTVWDARSGELKWRAREPGRFIFSVAFSIDGRILASGGQGNEVRFHDAESGHIRGRLLAFPKGEWAAIGGQGYSVSEGGEHHLRVIRNGSEENIDSTFRNRWLRHD